MGNRVNTSAVRVTGRRVVATVIDAVVLGGLASASNLGTGSGFGLTALSTTSLWLLLGAALYYVVAEGLTGRTVGTLDPGSRVGAAERGPRPGLLSAIARTSLRLVDGLFLYLVGFVVVMNSDHRRRLGDMAAKTLVVRA
jgi:uncharacterized RDD family membrane protein YckC